MLHIGALSRKLSRAIFHNMVQYGPKLEREQLLLGRLVDIGAELFAMSVSCAHAQSIIDRDTPVKAARALEITQYICTRGEQRITSLLRELHASTDKPGYQLAKSLLKE
jgi:hypothetical protein